MAPSSAQHMCEETAPDHRVERTEPNAEVHKAEI
jgi:hypothetical protein